MVEEFGESIRGGLGNLGGFFRDVNVEVSAWPDPPEYHPSCMAKVTLPITIDFLPHELRLLDDPVKLFEMLKVRVLSVLVHPFLRKYPENTNLGVELYKTTYKTTPDK